MSCQPCQNRLAQQPPPKPERRSAWEDTTQQPPIELAGGRSWIERHPSFGETYGLATTDTDGDPLPELCRRYPWHWPHCEQAEQRLRQSLAQLTWPAPSPPLVVAGPVLAVVDLSAELYYHGQLELLPRLGRAWQLLAPQWPGLRLWHNGGDATWLQEAFSQLGIPAERLICAHRHPHLQAGRLLVPPFLSPFGAPSPAALTWLRRFWAEAVAALAPASSKPRALLLSRPLQQRRPLLQHEDWQRTLARQGYRTFSPATSVAQQLQGLQQADRVVAAHGGAMANLLLLSAGAELIELANPAYTPPYFAGLLASGQLRHTRRTGEPTPQVLQDLLYAGPLEWPIDLPPPCFPA